MKLKMEQINNNKHVGILWLFLRGAVLLFLRLGRLAFVDRCMVLCCGLTRKIQKLGTALKLTWDVGLRFPKRMYQLYIPGRILAVSDHSLIHFLCPNVISQHIQVMDVQLSFGLQETGV
jgi:hypothetical protein